jgi:hypothetical protein
MRTGQKINDDVRRFFSQGYKSNNKMYHPDDPNVDLVQAERRMKHKDQSAAAHRAADLDNYGDYYELAQMVLRMPVGAQAGNCTQMAAVGLYWAVNRYRFSRLLCYICVITSPGDHVFALISDTPVKSISIGGARATDNYGRSFGSIGAFAKAPPAKTWMVIDPWLNTVCAATDYPLKAEQKLDDWAGKGKLVGWEGPRGLAFYPAGGHDSDYKKAFGSGPLEIVPFSIV